MTKSTQLILGDANLIKKQIKQINISQKSMLKIKFEIDLKIKKIGLESIVKSAINSVSNVAGAVGNTLGKAGKFTLLIMAKVWIADIQDGFSDFDSPILENFSAPGVSVPDISISDIAEEISSQIIEGGISNLIDTIEDQKNILFNNLSVSNIDELKYLQLVFIELKKMD
ncbi:hypothetical protein [Microcoleus sp. FACHB-672]|uniref:hypothetical protein n=1 Tax=Microcoleus sp. FACHB-672 TaxID=2692825 RepID=UPI00168A3B95|nr:hypothetical protein [Microcoleus sp. FACHB-672]MBD2043213.1 hypothetical protein [Microcoleus sp. FACHB-672]